MPDLSLQLQYTVREFLARREASCAVLEFAAFALDLENNRFGLTLGGSAVAFVRTLRGRETVTLLAAPHGEKARTVGELVRSHAEERSVRVVMADKDALAALLGLRPLDQIQEPKTPSEAARERTRVGFFRLYSQAHLAGLEAGRGCAPRRLIVELGRGVGERN